MCEHIVYGLLPVACLYWHLRFKEKKVFTVYKPRRPTKKYSLQKYGKRMSREGQTVTYTNIISIRVLDRLQKTLNNYYNFVEKDISAI